MTSKLQAILQGSRDLTLADDPGLDFVDAAELQLLLGCLDNPEYAPSFTQSSHSTDRLLEKFPPAVILRSSK